MAKQKISIKERLESALDLEKQEKYADALKVYRGIVRSDPLNTQVYLTKKACRCLKNHSSLAGGSGRV